jgi:hypothetical protein
MQVVINKCYGGFSISEEAIELYFKLKKWKLIKEEDKLFSYSIHYYKNKKSDKNYISNYRFKRNDKTLIKVVRKLGKKANGRFADLKIIKIPDGINWDIEEYDGIENICEIHRTWG